MDDMRIVYKEDEIIEAGRILLEMRDNFKYDDPKYKAIQLALEGIWDLPYEK